MDHTLEPGNPALASNRQFVYTKFLGLDGSGESASWNEARFIIRGVLLSNTDASSTMTIERYSLTSDSYSNVSSFVVSNTEGESRGYKFIISPWFNMSVDDAHYSLFHSGSSANFRVGSVHMQFRG
jgi:hypothetical protein